MPAGPHSASFAAESSGLGALSVTIPGMYMSIPDDLRAADGTVPTAPFCDYLYAQVTGWRTAKNPAQWPWREVISRGSATTGYLQGILLENYHYVRAAAVRQSPLLSHATSDAVFRLLREFVTGEAVHEQYFLESLTRWGIPAREILSAAPLTSTSEFIALQYYLAHKSVLDYLAGSTALEVDPEVYSRAGDPYEPWEKAYSLDPYILAPVRQHIRDDVAAGHASLFRLAALDTAPGFMQSETALSALRSARTVFEATRLWQRDIYETYQLSQAPAGMAV